MECDCGKVIRRAKTRSNTVHLSKLKLPPGAYEVCIKTDLGIPVTHYLVVPRAGINIKEMQDERDR